jgi:GTP pyrophosphokinase
MSLTLEIADIAQLSRVLTKIGQLPNVVEARRKT